MVDKTAVTFFHEQGYLTVEDVISPAEVAELRAVADSWVEASRSVTENTELFDLEPTHTAAHPQVRRVKNPGRNDAFARAYPTVLPHGRGAHRTCIIIRTPQRSSGCRSWQPAVSYADVSARIPGLPTDERILTIVKALLGQNLRGGGSKLNMKLAHVGSPVHWHQDWAFCESHCWTQGFIMPLLWPLRRLVLGAMLNKTLGCRPTVER